MASDKTTDPRKASLDELARVTQEEPRAYEQVGNPLDRSQTTVTIVVPRGYASAEEFCADCGFQQANSQTTAADDAPMPRGFMDALLKLCRHGLPASLLRDVMASQGIGAEVAASVIRNGLDIGSVELGYNLNICRSER